MAQDFSILLGAQVNTKTAQQQIDKIIKDSSKRKINLEVGLNTDKSLSNFNKQMAQIEQSLQQVTVKTREWTTAQGQLITQVEKIDKAGNTITQELNQQSDAYGNLTQKVTTYYKRAGEYNAQQISQTEQLITKQEALRNAYDNVVKPCTSSRKEVVVIEYLIAFFISVLASIADYYICKWLDRDE